MTQELRPEIVLLDSRQTPPASTGSSAPPPPRAPSESRRPEARLASYAEFLVAWNARYHGDTCPRRPSTEKEISVGGSPGVLLEYNCGILINIAGTVRHGVGYWFAFRYLSVHAASDPAGHAAFVEIRRSVEFPH